MIHLIDETIGWFQASLAVLTVPTFVVRFNPRYFEKSVILNLIVTEHLCQCNTAGTYLKSASSREMFPHVHSPPLPPPRPISRTSIKEWNASRFQSSRRYVLTLKNSLTCSVCAHTMYLLTELRRAGRENIWLAVMAYGPRSRRPYGDFSSSLPLWGRTGHMIKYCTVCKCKCNICYFDFILDKFIDITNFGNLLVSSVCS